MHSLSQDATTVNELGMLRDVLHRRRSAAERRVWTGVSQLTIAAGFVCLAMAGLKCLALGPLIWSLVWTEVSEHTQLRPLYILPALRHIGDYVSAN